MGLFDFSPPPPLEEKYKNALSHYLKDATAVHKKLAGVQSKLSEELASDEEILLITHGYMYGIDGFGIVTNRRVFRFKSKLEKQIPLMEIADMQSHVYPSGDFDIYLISHAALPYASFWGRGESPAAHKFYENTLMLSMPTSELIDQFKATVELAKKGLLRGD